MVAPQELRQQEEEGVAEGCEAGSVAGGSPQSIPSDPPPTMLGPPPHSTAAAASQAPPTAAASAAPEAGRSR